MAAADRGRTSSFLRKTEEDLQCPVCFEIFVEPWIPKMLGGCIHVVCLVCLGSINSEGKDTLKCPECRQITYIPNGGVKGLKTNMRVLSLAQNYHKYNVKKNESMYQNCEIHDSKVKDLVCTKCKKVICPTCYEQSHKSHQVQALETFKTQRKKEQDQIAEKLETEMANLNVYSEKLSKMEETVQRAVEIEHEKLHRHVESIIAALKEKEDEMMTELHEVTKSVNLQNIRDERIRVGSLIGRIKSIQEDEESSSILTDAVTDDKIHQQEINQAKRKSLVNESTRIHGQVKLNMNIGQFQAKSLELDIGEFEKKGKLQLVTSFGVFKDPRSVALTPTGLVVVLDKAVTEVGLHVFEHSRKENTYVLKRTLKLNEYDSDDSNPVGLAITGMDKFLVACGTCVDVFSSTGQYKESLYTKRVDSQPIHKRAFMRQSSQSFRGAKPKNAAKAHCVVVTNDGKIVVGNSEESTITIFNADHTIFKDSFKIPLEGFKPMRLATKDSQVAMIDVDNEILCAIDIKTGKLEIEINELRSPQDLCYSYDTILITVGMKDGTVEQYCCKSGVYLGQVAHGLLWPQNIAALSNDRVVVLGKDTANVFNINRVE